MTHTKVYLWAFWLETSHHFVLKSLGIKIMKLKLLVLCVTLLNGALACFEWRGEDDRSLGKIKPYTFQ